MGTCCQKEKDSTDEQVQLYIESTGIEEISEMFRAAAGPLSTLNDINNSLSSTPLKKATFTHILNDVQLIDAIQGMLYAYSAETDGDLSKLNFKIELETPYIAINKDKLPNELKHISDAWDEIVTGLETAPDKLKNMPGELQVILEESKAFPDKARDICSTKGLNPREIYKVVGSVSANMKKIAKAKQIMEKTFQTVEELKVTFLSLKERFNNDEMEKINEIGQKAFKENSKTPKEIISKYWPDAQRINHELLEKSK